MPDTSSVPPSVATLAPATQRSNKLMLLAVVLAPILVKLPLILGWRLADARYLDSRIATSVVRHSLATLDPNISYTSQALGHRAALDLLSGHLPWWNPYSGVGMPLAGDMQSAALSPLTLLLALPNGQLYMHIALQIIAGLFTVLLMRRMGTSALAAGVAGLLFEFNGTFAWLANAVVNPLPFLPMTLLGVEEVRRRLLANQGGGWMWISAGIALSLYAGFPETAYFDGLLIAVWSLVRLHGLPLRRTLPAYVVRLCFGVGGGVLLAAPILIAFMTYLAHAYVGGHTNDGFRYIHLDSARLIGMALPYALGRLGDPGTGESWTFWGSVGGYAGAMLITLGCLGGVGQSLRSLRIGLFAWSAIVIASIYGLPILQPAFASIPGVGIAMYFRYFTPSVSFALAILAGLTCQDLSALAHPTRRHWVAFGGALTFIALSLILATPLLIQHPYRSNWLWGSLAVTSVLLLGTAYTLKSRRFTAPDRARTLGALVVFEAILLFAIPTQYYPKSGILQEGGITFLQQHLGLQRFYTLGPIQPNYGAYYGIAGINHNDLPLPATWVDFIKKKLDGNTNETQFDGHDRISQNGPTALDNLKDNIDSYRNVGVKYIISATGNSPFDWIPPGMEVPKDNATALALYPGQRATLILPSPPTTTTDNTRPIAIASVNVLVATYGNQSDGKLALRICTASGTCTSSLRNLSEANDNQYLVFPLNAPLALDGTPLTIELRKLNGSNAVALWGFPTTPTHGRTFSFNGTVMTDHEPHITFALKGGNHPTHVYHDVAMQIDELSNPRPYFEAAGCTQSSQSREHTTVDCPAPTTLARLELFMPGWTATVNGQPQPVVPDGPLFQKVALPAGRSDVVFHFQPPHMGWGYVAFALGLGMMLWGAPRRRAISGLPIGR